MPSCPSKLSILRESKFYNSLETEDCLKQIFFQFLSSSTCSCLLYDTKIVSSNKVLWCCVKTNRSCYYYWVISQVPNYCKADVKKLTEKLCILSIILKNKCIVQRLRNIVKICKLIVLHLFNHNVIWLLFVIFYLKLLSYFFIAKQLIYTKQKLLCTISYISYGKKIKSVMEVDETVKEINSIVNKLPNGNNYSPSEKSDEINLSVINDSQIIKSEYHQLNNSVMCGNSIDVKIKEEVSETKNIEIVANGNVITNHHSNLKEELEFKKSVDLIEKPQTDKEVINKNIKDKPNGGNDEVISNSIKCELNEKKPSGNNEEIVINSVKCELSEKNSNENIDEVVTSSVKCGLNETKPIEGSDEVKTSSVKCEPNEKKPNDVCDQEDKINEKIKSSNEKLNEIEKIKTKEKDQCVNNVSLNQVSSSSSSSSKKYDSPSKSHQSSSSSRHKHRDSREDRHKSSSSSSNKNNDISVSSRKDEDKSKSDSRSKSRSCHHKSDEKCHCKSHHRSHHHSKSKKFQSVKTQCTADEIAFELRQKKDDPSNPYFTRVPWVPHPQLANLKYGRFYRIEVDRNGGASVCHLYVDEISHLSEAQLKECAIEFVKLSYSEDENDCAYHVMGIVHGAASYLPDLVDYMADHYPTLTVKTGSLASRDNHTTTMSQYRDEVYKTYSNGTFRYAPLDQLSICGVLGEEVGAYFPDFVARLEQSPFMKPVMPWSFLSVVQTDNPRESNDGPIFWVRPGEQMLPANEALKESARPKKRRNNELDNLYYIGGARSSEARESLFMDRTKAHADQVGVDYGISNTAPTAAVGVLKAVNCGHPEHGNRATKDVVAFHAQDYNELLEILMLDLYEPPQTQCTKWIEVSKLNTLRREGIRYAHLQLHDNDVYYLPRKIIHQFQTISSVASVAWHIRYRDYFSVLGAPNLHTPTGINKGQVFYEKKNVAVYCPPVCENDLLAAVANSESGLKTPKKVERLKEYSPFKHSPRKMHKHQSPRSLTKKQVEVVPPQSSNNIKTEPTTPPIDQEKKRSSSSKKRERSHSTDGKQVTDHGTKRNHEDESRKAESSDSSHGHRSSGEHTPKKDRKSQDSRHSSHRKEVKNLSAEFSSKKEKSSRDKSPKREKHDKKRSDDRSSKRDDRHERSSKSKSSSSSNSRYHEKRREHKENSHKSKTEMKNDKEHNKLKRKHESPNHSPSKKIKTENPETVIAENSRKSPKQEPQSSSDSHMPEVIKEKDTVDCEMLEVKNENEECKNDENKNSVMNEKECVEEKTSNPNVEGSENDKKIKSNDFDLEQNVAHTDLLHQIPPPPPPPPPLTTSVTSDQSSPVSSNCPATENPPPDPENLCLPSELPSSTSVNTSPSSETLPPPSASSVSNSTILSDSPLPPNSENPLPNSDPLCASPSLSNSLEDNCITSKEKSDNHVKKVKKKVVKKEPESYDLLGDIMSKMDKKK